jgi:hypothetical protein
VNKHKRPSLPGLDGPAILKEAGRILEKRVEQPSRRAFLRSSLTLGGLAMLSGCSLSDDESVEKALRPRPVGADLSRIDDHAALPLQCLLRH